MVAPIKDSARATKSKPGLGEGVLPILTAWSHIAKKTEPVGSGLGNVTKILWFPNSIEPKPLLKCFNFKIHAFNIRYSWWF